MDFCDKLSFLITPRHSCYVKDMPDMSVCMSVFLRPHDDQFKKKPTEMSLNHRMADTQGRSVLSLSLRPTIKEKCRMPSSVFRKSSIYYKVTTIVC